MYDFDSFFDFLWMMGQFVLNWFSSDVFFDFLNLEFTFPSNLAFTDDFPFIILEWAEFTPITFIFSGFLGIVLLIWVYKFLIELLPGS